MAGSSQGVRKGWDKRRLVDREREIAHLRDINYEARGGGMPSGVKVSLQNIQEEYVPKLAALIDRVAIADRMDNDSSVKSVLRGNIYPLISSSQWEVEGGEDEHRELVSANLLRKGPKQLWCSTPFEQRIFEQAQQLKYGFMAFGKTRVVVDGYVIYDTLKYLAPGSFGGPLGPWEFDSTGGKLAAIHRAYTVVKAGKTETITDERIPIEDVFLGVWEMCGDNWEGKALIRSAYKDWAMKEQAEKFGMVHLQNVGVGIPRGKLAAGGSGIAAANNMKSILESLRGGSVERRYMMLNPGEEVDWMTSDASTDLSSPIVQLHARGISAAGTMQFLGDGNTESGSRASGSVHMVAYYQAVEAIRVIFQEQLNHGWGSQLGLVEDLIYSNYDEVEECPRIVGSAISPSTQLENATMIGDLIQKGAMSHDLGAENYLRKALRMPPISPEEFQRIVDQNKPTPQLGGRPNEVGDTDRQDPRNDKLGRAVGMRARVWDGASQLPRKYPSYPWSKSTAA